VVCTDKVCKVEMACFDIVCEISHNIMHCFGFGFYNI